MSLLDVPFDQLTFGSRVRSRGRTMTETDVVNFCMLTGNWLEIHSNIEFAESSHFGKRLVQGSLVFSIIPGLFSLGRFITAFYGVDRLRFVAPVFIGDTVHLEPEIVGLEERDEKHGVVTLQMDVKNQKDVLVQTCQFRLLMLRKDPEA